MIKKKILITGGILLVILLVVILLFVSIKNNKVNEEVKFDTKVASSITMDINPSIKIELNKDDKVVNIYALNEDAKDIISEDYKEKTLDDIIKNITDNLKNKDYFKEDATIIITVTGSIKSEKVKEIITNTAKNDNINVNILEPNITKSGKKLAEELGITEAKASYLEEVINKNPNLNPEDIKDKSVSEIENITKENSDKNNDQTSKPNNETTKPNTETTKPSGGNSLQKCESMSKALNNEEAGKKAASLKGATVGTGSYCDILPPESVLTLSSDGTCAYKVSFEYMTNKCVYYISMATGEVLSSNCTHKDINEGEHQCLIMKDLGVTKREMAYIYDTVDNGSEYTSRVEDVYGTPDAEGKNYVYRYHVAKATGSITKEIMYELK